MINNNGGDDYSNRLLSYLDSQFTEKIIKIAKIREYVYIVETVQNKYVVKGYSSHNKLRLQEAFTDTLKKEGFLKTYSFVHHLSKTPLLFEGKYFGCMDYLAPDRKSFTFSTHRNRLEGLSVVEEFHQITGSVVPRYQTLLPFNDIQAKWQDRLKQFEQNLSLLHRFLKEKYHQEMVQWGEWALKGMKKYTDSFVKEPYVVLHGDVAHHNFLRDKKGRLNLIDFDLISIGPPTLDYLQYANRILPFLDWSLEELHRYPAMQAGLKQPAFLYALAYPADIFREWNRVIREKSYSNPAQFQQVIELTFDQYYLRRKMVETLNKVVK